MILREININKQVYIKSAKSKIFTNMRAIGEAVYERKRLVSDKLF